jgi:ADP-ribose pyrophosphatase
VNTSCSPVMYSSASMEVRRRMYDSNGDPCRLDFVARPAVSLVIPLTNEGDAVLIEQYRAAAGAFVVEFPAGRAQPGENARETALREVEEETGFVPDDLVELGALRTAPHFSDEIVSVYLGRGEISSGQSLTGSERINVIVLEQNQVYERIRPDSLGDAKTFTAWSMYLAAAGSWWTAPERRWNPGDPRNGR